MDLTALFAGPLTIGHLLLVVGSYFVGQILKNRFGGSTASAPATPTATPAAGTSSLLHNVLLEIETQGLALVKNAASGVVQQLLGNVGAPATPAAAPVAPAKPS